ncbi:MAG: hypothetical protein U1E78_08400 [Gammaproteobacteria bacterium]
MFLLVQGGEKEGQQPVEVHGGGGIENWGATIKINVPVTDNVTISPIVDVNPNGVDAPRVVATYRW